VNKPFLVLSNITGEPNVPITIEVYKKFASVPFETITLANIPATASVKFDLDTYLFMQTPGDYEIRIIQIQSSVLCLLSSDLVSYTVPRQLFASVGTMNESYPDRPTGSLQVRSFDGGISPYDVRIELDSASSFELPAFETDFTEVGLNSNSQFEQDYKNIPAGRYKVQVVDSVGCFIEIIARVPLDTDIYIPNIFTPNGDGSNDVFYIRNLPTPGAKLIVSNRWGKQVFSSSDYKNDWTGEGLADGVYFYRLSGGDSGTVNGWVEILRGEKP
jgi:gliding motility-associated-like protein